MKRFKCVFAMKPSRHTILQDWHAFKWVSHFSECKRVAAHMARIRSLFQLKGQTNANTLEDTIN